MQHVIDIISEMRGIEMNVDELIDDVFILTIAYPDPLVFQKCTIQIIHSIEMIVAGRIKGTPLSGNLSGWRSYHFQSERTNGHRADLRLVYQEVGELIRIRGFGNRDLPSDFYQRIYGR